jgi:flagellar protein FlaG
MDIGTISNSMAGNTPSIASTGSPPATPASAPVSAAPVQTANAVQQASMTPSLDQVKQAVQQINSAMQSNARGLEFSLDDESDRTIVKVVDTQTQKVIRQIPTEEALAIAKSLEKAIGSLVKEKA